MAEERKHSILAPSSKEWIHCGFSAKFLANKEEEITEANQFGTECHALAEYYIKKSLKLNDFEEDSISLEDLKSSFIYYDDEMEKLASGYANYVVGTADYEAKRTRKKPIVFVEQLLEMDYAPDTHGTADAIIISDDVLTIIDNKTGFLKVKVRDEETGELNSQLGIYGLFAYKLFNEIYPIKKVRLVIYQERINNISDETIDIEDLLEWEVSVLRPAAKEAMNPNAEAVSGKHCKYCPGRAVCAKRNEDSLKNLDINKKPELLNEAEIEALLPRLDLIIEYCESVKDYCLKKALNGKKWSGFKLVESTTKRKLSDEKTVEKLLLDKGYKPYTPQKLMSITELQKLLGKATFNELLADYITKPKGQPVLAPESDAREEYITEEK